MSDWPFVARNAEADRVSGLLDDATTAAVVVRGPAGVGKSALVAHVAAESGRSLAKVRAESTIAPFDGIGLLRPDVLAVGSLDPAGFVQAVVDRWSDGAPDLVWVDDVGHLDEASAVVLFHVASHGWSKLLLTERDGAPPSPLVAQLRGVGLLASVDLSPFDRRACEAVLTARLGGVVGPRLVDRVLDRSGGNPLVIRELVRAGLADDVIRATPDGWAWVGGDAIVDSAAALTAAHMSALAPPARDLVDVLVIAGDVEVDALTSAEREAAAALVRSEVGIVDDGRLRIAHPLFAEAARIGLEGERRLAALGSLVRHTSASAPGVVHRLRVLRWRRELGDDVPPAELVDGTNLAMSVFDTMTAAELGQAAVDAGESSAALPLALALTYAGRLEEASTAAKVAVESATDDATLAIASITGTLARAYRTGFGPSVVADQRALLERVADPSLQTFVRSELCSSLAFSGHLEEAVELGAVHVAAGEWWERLPFVPGWAGAASALGRTGEVLATLDAAVSSAGGEAGRAVAWLHAFRASAALVHGDLDLAAHAISRFDELAYLAMVPGVAAVLRSETRGVAALWRGDLDTAVDLLREAVARSDVPESDFRRVVPCSFLAVALAQTGDADGADAAAVDAADAAARFPLGAAWAPWARAWANLARGDRTGAARVAAAGARSAMDRGQWSSALWCAADAWWFAPSRAGAHLVVDVASRVDGSWSHAFRAAAMGWVERDPELLAEAAEVFARLGAVGHRQRLAALSDGGSGRGPGPSQRTIVDGLTRREVEVATLAASGRANREIAEALGISIRTAETHLHRAMGKLGAEVRDDLVTHLDDLRRRA